VRTAVLGRGSLVCRLDGVLVDVDADACRVTEEERAVVDVLDEMYADWWLEVLQFMTARAVMLPRAVVPQRGRRWLRM
jgi:hypothetical protein